jgi:hypothetical protein
MPHNLLLIRHQRLENNPLVDLTSAIVPAIVEVEPAWGLEIERRLAEYDRGETYSIVGDVVFAKARSIAR